MTSKGKVTLRPDRTANGKAAELERTRMNQRRCRARRKQYVAELEDKIRNYETTTDGDTIVHTKVDQLLKENDMLKSLLKSLGLEDGFLKQYMKAGDRATELSRSQADGEPLPQIHSASTLPDIQPYSASLAISSRQSPIDNMLITSFNEPTPEIPQESYESLFQSATPSSWNYQFDITKIANEFTPGSLDGSSFPSSALLQQPLNADEELPLHDFTSTSTTLCSVAFSMIVKNNRKGYSQPELDLRLRAGYRCGLSESGACHVENKILFEVLAEIS